MKQSRLWTLHLLAAVGLLVLLSAHMGLMHLDDVLGQPGATGWTQVLARGKEFVFLITYTLLLGAALYHGLFGLKNILGEFFSSEKAERRLAWTCTVVGIGLFAYGAYAIVAAFRLQGG